MKNRQRFLAVIKNKSIMKLWMGDVCYSAVAIALLIKLSEIAVKAGLKVKGYSYLTNANIKFMLSSPVVIAIFLGIFFLALVMTLAETAALVIGIAETDSGNGLSWGRVIFGGIKGIKKLKHKSYVLLMIPATIIRLLLIVWIRVRYIYEMENIGVVCVALILLFVLAAFTAFLTETVVACMIIEDMTVRKAWHTVILVFREQRKHFLKDLAIINVIIAAASYIAYIVLVIAVTFIVLLVMPSSIQLAMTMTVSNYIARLMTMLYINAVTVINLYIITRWCIPRFYSHDGREDIHSLCLLSGYENTIIYKKKKPFFALIGLLCVAFLVFYGYDSIHNGTLAAEKALSAISITSHRGASRQAPENTLPAIAAAIENMADYAEIDVQETLDGRLVLMHDLSLMRTAGVDLYVSDLTYRQLMRYDVGSWFSDDFTNTKIPTLEEVLQLADGKIGFNIELKRTKSGGDLAEKVVELIQQYGMVDKVVITSSDYKYLREIKKLDHTFTTGYILTSLMGGGYNDKNIDFYSVKYSYVSSTVVDKIHSSGKGIHVWTVNNKTAIDRMKRYGVDSIITDSPALAREVLYDNGAAATVFDMFKRILL